ncbi:unnamed protein product [Hymenolepis diminuta]|uniref:Uncharacterized protein n=1 Tax=Hymenolepis diminuta TaxID=6216 RepID=A0A564Z4E7_HYMDI|nr:unnamed protein product [Hymenolepis diminuta]VUZ54391.1 unnamed protein product [Hymenolepis diminuta]VUZ54423.1 unnamed protein product [Hymenolepis diminuta]VUZ55046.1 unnamed protein product [Hymenolepis diminuta]
MQTLKDHRHRREKLQIWNSLKGTAMIHPSQKSPQKWNSTQSSSDQITKISKKNFRSSLVIPILDEGRSSISNCITMLLRWTWPTDQFPATSNWLNTKSRHHYPLIQSNLQKRSNISS